jgi:hypothetical protein
MLNGSWCDVHHIVRIVEVGGCTSVPGRKMQPKASFGLEEEPMQGQATTARMELSVHTVTLTLTRVHISSGPIRSRAIICPLDFLFFSVGL